MHLQRAAVAAAIVSSSLGACSSGRDAGISGGTTGGGGATVCSTFASPPKDQLPRVDSGAAQAAGVLNALKAILEAQSPPLPTDATSYTFTSLACHDLTEIGPAFVDGYSCHFTIKAGSAAPVTVDVPAPSQLAQNLFDALQASGATRCDDVAHGHFLNLQNVTLTAGGIAFDDASNEALTPTPNLLVHGADAQNVVEAFGAAGIDDCTESRKVFVLCNTFSGQGSAPTCSYSWNNLWKVGSSDLVYTCGSALPNGMDPQSPGGTLDTAHSLAIWNALLAAAKDASFKPLHGTIEQTTIVNASYFGFDGTNLGLTFVADDATPPPFTDGGGPGPEAPTP